MCRIRLCIWFGYLYHLIFALNNAVLFYLNNDINDILPKCDLRKKLSSLQICSAVIVL